MKWAWLVVVAACGDNTIPTKPGFEIAGHADLGARGMNSALAVAGTAVYVGSRIDRKPIEIVDITDPTKPNVVGQIGPPTEGFNGISSRELRAVPELNLLVVLDLGCATDLHGCLPGSTPESIALYDITDRFHPQQLDRYNVVSSGSRGHSPHEFFVWRDPADHGHVLVYLTEPGGPPQLEVLDISTRKIVSVMTWDAVRDGGIDGTGTDNILHSISVSADGKTGYLSHQQGGLVIVDLSHVGDATPAISMITPPSQVLDWAPPGIGPHSAVQAADRPLLIVTEEIYPMPYGLGCPWGHLRTVDITDPTRPTIAGEFGVPENATTDCSSFPPLTAYTAHNATVTNDLALVTWYAGGIEAIDVSDPASPRGLAELRPDPLPMVDKEDPGLSGSPIEMWSYPVIQDGLIYVVDVRNGLYVLRYHGKWSEEVEQVKFLEGNSNLSI